MNPDNYSSHSMREPGSLARLHRPCHRSLARLLLTIGLVAGVHVGVRAQVFSIDFAAPPLPVPPVAGGCAGLVAQADSFQFTVRPGFSYRFTFIVSLAGAPPPCLASTPASITVSLGANFENLSIRASPDGPFYTGEATIPDAACGETAVTYTCDGNLIRETTFLGLPVRLAASTSDDCSSARPCNVDTPPTIVCPDNIETNTDLGQCSAVVTYPDPTFTGSPVPTVTCTPSSGSAFPTGTTTVNCTAANSAGSDDCSFRITVRDAEPPSITCAPPSSASAGTDCQAAVPDVTSGTTDNCPAGLVVSQNPAAGTLAGLGTTPITVTATDAGGNTAQCTTTFTVVNFEPVITSVAGPSSPLAMASSICLSGNRTRLCLPCSRA